MLAALSAAAITLVAGAALGARDSAGDVEDVAGPSTVLPDDTPDGADDDGDGPSADPGATAGPGVIGATPAPSADSPTTPKGEPKSTVGATREGVHADHFEFGIHGPLTLDGAPLNLAEDPVTGFKGFITHLNRKGGVNGRKVRMFLEDDRYTTAGGRQAADRLTKEIKPFMISGTLGIDQIHKVMLAAHGAKIPYFAGGGPEPEFKGLGMFQNLSSYDQYSGFLVDYICKYGKSYVGGEVRLGTTTLNSDLIIPVEKRFVSALEKRKCVKTPVDPKARGKINKPTEQTSYTAQALDLRSAYGGAGANLVVPLQDPISTSRQVLEWSSGGYRPKWTFSNFAHDADLVLTLMQGQWTGTRGLSGACYYHPKGGGKPYDAKLCAAMGEAHRQWVGLGSVTYDQNAGGNVGGKGSYNYTESSWETDGSGGAAGYQGIGFWVGAMKAIGTDPTREKFAAALAAYDGYSNLITGPITFKGSSNRMIGAKRFVVLEGQENLEYKQIVSLTPGLVDHF
jgi:ABC-type branched-subunit amino acid transport system substrate-binding protein